jgi:spore cortex formation protein SpoVR/YcgB (stage V sporulation)
MEEMAQILGEEVQLPQIETRGKKNLVTRRDRYNAVRQVGPESLKRFKRTIRARFYETIFEVVDADDLSEIAAFGGCQTCYPHWAFGMQYEELGKGYDYGLSKMYEMVINNDPCYAYLMRCNHTVDQKLVMAHVYGHCDFFKNYAYFNRTSRRMMDDMANPRARIRGYVERFGEDEVERFLDRCISIGDQADVHATASLTNRGKPRIYVVDGNYRNHGELPAWI